MQNKGITLTDKPLTRQDKDRYDVMIGENVDRYVRDYRWMNENDDLYYPKED